MTATATPTAQQQQTAQLLVLLRQYVVSHVRQFPFLLPSVATLREAAGLYGRNDPQGAYQKGVEAYQFIMRTRAAFPSLPLP
ncbi:hypothetical protein QLQ12_09930 [Actinoplanes sp. NEAU-A12]|uniref:TipAS antibiotic-recognition domain-containing protein n=1 Tax=Actinoplanes sandaracinus TaxID=3045177 RepID=A0ABT6WGR2_9ACTN|nr:hypothetical protein [Actinoplanes sandaracinus]MDI6098918.1 hypothetical protein [Actinoplanes sandaracinus]